MTLLPSSLTPNAPGTQAFLATVSARKTSAPPLWTPPKAWGGSDRITFGSTSAPATDAADEGKGEKKADETTHAPFYAKYRTPVKLVSLPEWANRLSGSALLGLSFLFPGIALTAGIGLAIGLPIIGHAMDIKVCDKTNKVTNTKDLLRKSNKLIDTSMHILRRLMGWLPGTEWKDPIYRSALWSMNAAKKMGINYLRKPESVQFFKTIPKSTFGKILYFSKMALLVGLKIVESKLKKFKLLGWLISAVIGWGLLVDMNKLVDRLFPKPDPKKPDPPKK